MQYNVNQWTSSSVILEASSFSLTHTASSSPNLCNAKVNCNISFPKSIRPPIWIQENFPDEFGHLLSDTPIACTSAIPGWPCKNSSISLYPKDERICKQCWYLIFSDSLTWDKCSPLLWWSCPSSCRQSCRSRPPLSPQCPPCASSHPYPAPEFSHCPTLNWNLA